MTIQIVITVLLILLLHFISDFIFQAEEWAINKSKDDEYLIAHTATYSFIMFLGMIPIFHTFTTYNWLGSFFISFLFGFICLVFHTFTDYFTSRIVAKKFANKQYGSPIPNFEAFTIIGGDQLLHYIQLLLAWYFLS